VTLGYGAPALAVFRGREAQAAQLIQAATDDAGRRGEGGGLSLVLIEAAVRSAVLERAAGAVQRLSGIARACGTDWAGGVEARSRALVSEAW
jgi:hypothetical protein